MCGLSYGIIKQMEEIEENKTQVENCPEKKKFWLDILLVMLAMVVSILIRLPSIFLTNVPEEERSEYYSENGALFLKDMDSYHFLKKTNIILGNDDSQLQTYDNGLPVITASVFRFLNLFSQVSVEQVAGVIGPIIFSFSCIPAYIFVRRKTNRVGGFFSALLIGIMPALVVANEFLIFDTDILATVLPLTMALLFVLAIEAGRKGKRILFSILAVTFAIILGFSWHSSSVYFYLFFAVSGVMLAYFLIRERFKFKKFFSRTETRTVFSLLLSFLLVFILLLSFGFLKDNLKIFGAREESFYPESDEFVQELSDLPFIEGEKITDFFSVLKDGSVNILGGVGLFSLACVSVIFLGVVIFANRGETCGKLSKKLAQYKGLTISGVLLVVWFLGAMASLSFGLRFTKIATVPVCLLAGMMIGILFEKRRGKRAIVGALIVVALAVFPSFSAITASFVSKPSVDWSLEETASYIKEELGDDFVVATWWETGHYFEYAGLDVLVDAGTASGGEMFWIGMAFSTDDPKLSEGIFRMLAVDGLELSAPRKAIEMADGNYTKGVEMLKEILPLEKEEARKTLQKKSSFSEEDISELLSFSYPEESNKIAVVILDDMMNKSDSIFYYGMFDLEKGESGYQAFDFERVNNSMLYRLYNEKDDFSEFQFKKKIDDRLEVYGSRIWVIE